MARNEQLVRQLRILQILERSKLGRTLAELSQELIDQLGLSRLSERTVRRDLESLQAAGFDVDASASVRGVVWKIGPSLRGAPKIAASCTEMLALSIGRDLLVPLVGTPYWQGIESLCGKMQEVLPEPVGKHFDKLRRQITVRGTPAKSYIHQQGILATLNRAISQHRVVEIEYQGLGKTQPEAREIEPYALALFQGSIYVVAMPASAAESADVMRHWKLDRFRKATALDRRFKPRADFDPQQHFANSLGIFRNAKPVSFTIALSPLAATLVAEEPWHADQRMAPRPDGRTLLTIPSAYPKEIVPRVLALGAEVELLAPIDVREELSKSIREMADIYSRPA